MFTLLRPPALVLALVLSGSQLAWAAPVTKFDPATQVAGQALLLNGSGTRHRMMFAVYDMALYTSRRVTTTADLLTLPGPKRLSFTALREIPGTDLGLAFIKGLQANSPPDLVQKHTVSSTRLIDIFSGKSKMAPGETFAMEYVPDQGTTFYIQNQPQGKPVGDAEFFNMILRIWVGPSPADNDLRDGLLGKEH